MAKTPQKYIDPPTASGQPLFLYMPWECDVLAPCTTFPIKLLNSRLMLVVLRI